MTATHFNALFSPSFSFSLRFSCAHAASLGLHFNFPVHVVPGVLLVLNRNKNKYLSRDVS